MPLIHIPEILASSVNGQFLKFPVFQFPWGVHAEILQRPDAPDAPSPGYTQKRRRW